MKRSQQKLQPKIIDVNGLLGYLILHEISRAKLCGDDLAEAIGRRRGTRKLTPGTIYPALKYIRDNKLAKVTVKGRKKLYSITAKGKKEYSLAKKVLKLTLKGALK